MNITIFNRTYTVRRFGEQTVVRGYVTTSHEDFTVSLDVYPSGSETMQALPEGERRVRRLEAAGSDILHAANQDTGEKGDLLYYHGEWYECISAVLWDHTMLNHWNYVFVLVPQDAAGTIDLSDPGTDEDTESEDGEEESESTEDAADEGDVSDESE